MKIAAIPAGNLAPDFLGSEHESMIPSRGLRDNSVDEKSSKTSESDSESTKDLNLTDLKSETFVPAGIAVKIVLLAWGLLLNN